MARGFIHRIVVGVLAGATLVATPAPAVAKPRDCKATRRDASTDPACDRAATSVVDAAASAEEARVAAARAKRLAERTDYQLLYIYPGRPTYDKLRSAELKGAIDQVDRAMTRLTELRANRVTIDEKAEFYQGKPLPPDLQPERGLVHCDGARVPGPGSGDRSHRRQVPPPGQAPGGAIGRCSAGFDGRVFGRRRGVGDALTRPGRAEASKITAD